MARLNYLGIAFFVINYITITSGSNPHQYEYYRFGGQSQQNFLGERRPLPMRARQGAVLPEYRRDYIPQQDPLLTPAGEITVLCLIVKVSLQLS
jgi:hypothetical protein